MVTKSIPAERRDKKSQAYGQGSHEETQGILVPALQMST